MIFWGISGETMFEKAKLNCRNELNFLAGFSYFNCFLEILVVGIEIIKWFKALWFLIEGKDLAFYIFGDNL